MWLGACLLLAGLWLQPAGGAASAETVTVLRVEADWVLVLADGRSVRLAGLETPGTAQQRFADAAVTRLRERALGRPLTLLETAPAEDRYGRARGLVLGGDGAPLQIDLLGEGLARVDFAGEPPAGWPQLLSAEAAARFARKGLWGEAEFRVRDATNVGLLDRFGLVEGRVREVARSKRWIWLNFGDDWRRDFTIGMRLARARALGAMTWLEALQGRLVRVRGWLRWYNGPYLELDHPASIEILAPDGIRYWSPDGSGSG
ncbi:thermonuclease family protein [Oceanibacterium hippocampi]|uniref:TNase-like domain-containing protein n=1 Tax=Oceanibacterium hippocampi TaxID=745714 RepID=A0A1Y5RAN1_9PROT|nr:thermonuclease family protein [Oceanibacterium hippocampi]SLN10290.1 hypothetical protein OCH7691_00033 [Oceanibacterium hippocampi]